MLSIKNKNLIFFFLNGEEKNQWTKKNKIKNIQSYPQRMRLRHNCVEIIQFISSYSRHFNLTLGSSQDRLYSLILSG